MFTIVYLITLIASFFLIRKYTGKDKKHGKELREKARGKNKWKKGYMGKPRGIFASSTFETFRNQTNQFIHKLSKDYLNFPTTINEKNIASESSSPI